MNVLAAASALLLAGGLAGGDAQLGWSNNGDEVHCVAEALPLDVDIAPAALVCFDTTAAADAYLDRATARSLAASVTVGTVYADSNYGGSSLTLWGSNGCAGVTFGFASLSGGWDSRISSARASNGCWVTLYSATSYGGSRITCTPSCSSIGSLNDQVRSLVFRPSGTWG
jgi:hypothetical protein